jgi:protein-S-isoprenylcysteine O-methyltransferase Ste14
MYVRLAWREDREALAEFGEAYASYAANTPAFFPRWPPLIEVGAS